MPPSVEAQLQWIDSVAEMPQTPAGKIFTKGWTLPQVGNVPVKNTFIDDLPEDLPEEDHAIPRTTSAPALIGAMNHDCTPRQPAAPHLVTLLSPPGLEANEKRGRNQGSEDYAAKSDSEGSTLLSPLGSEANEKRGFNVESEDYTSKSDSEGSFAEETVQSIDDLPDAKLSSLGAALHGTGQCKPCAWFHKPQSCFRGRDCRHCHACSPDELENRKKSKVALLKSQGVKKGKGRVLQLDCLV